jgi:hypothetical protein
VFERAKQEAERKRADSERLSAHAVRVTAARQLARRCDWVTALPEYHQVIRDGESDALRLRAERLVGFFALNAITDLSAELNDLSRLNLGDLAAQVNLIRGAWLLCDFDKQGEGRALVREALDNRHHLLSPADVAFAEALAAERVGQDITSLRRAVDADPFHYLASGSIAVALAVVGDVEETRRQARFLRGVFHYSPMPDLADALVALIESDAEGLKSGLAKVAEKLPAERRPSVTRLVEFLQIVLELRKISIRISASQGLGGFLEVPAP